MEEPGKPAARRWPVCVLLSWFSPVPLLVAGTIASTWDHRQQPHLFRVLDDKFGTESGFSVFTLSCLAAGTLAVALAVAACRRKEKFWPLALVPGVLGLLLGAYIALALLLMLRT